MGKVFFGADFHFGHRNIIAHCNRPFSSVDEMNAYMTDRINSVVAPSDHLYILGDFSFRGGDPAKYIEHIRCCNIHCCLGNHDRAKGMYNLLNSSHKVKTVDKTIELARDGQCIFMSHYPCRSWPKSFHGSWHLYGHVHSRLDHEDRASKRKTLDVGVDNCVNYGKLFGEPWSFDEIADIMATRNGVIDV